MTPRVALQQQIIDWLFRQVESGSEFFTRNQVKAFRRPGFVLEAWDEEELADRGLPLPEWAWESGLADRRKAVVEIFLEQVDDSGPVLKVRNLLGSPLLGYGATYDLESWVQQRGGGFNRLRTVHVAQPGALKIGDRLITGEKVIDEPREGGNGTVYVHLSGPARGIWLGLPSRIPLALLTQGEEIPGLVEG